MFEFIRVQYALGRLTKEQVWAFWPKYLTADEAEAIVTNA